ncbi:hypothetical protein JTB14_022962 [Gonioctena quinquepunctata]|nr:hypothetical protein JTB14_022962 [Gonioctena quinquepunctata]
MKPFEDAYNEACSLWMRKYSNVKITLKYISGLVNTAFSRICRMELAQSGFFCTGISPLNGNVFSDIDFSASLIGNRPRDAPISHMDETEAEPSPHIGPSSETCPSSEAGPSSEASHRQKLAHRQMLDHLQKLAHRQKPAHRQELPHLTLIRTYH